VSYQGCRVRVKANPPTRIWNTSAWERISNATGVVKEVKILTTDGDHPMGFLVIPDPERTEARTIPEGGCEGWWLIADEFTEIPPCTT
jgi:hypothetical protein